MTVEHVIVAVPARDEEETLAACLESVLVASAHVEVPVTVVVVLDGCVDASAEIARGFAGVLRSLDGGRSWSPASSGIGRNAVQALATDPRDPRVVVASIRQRGSDRASRKVPLLSAPQAQVCA